jgi:hypothetical protein
MDVRTMLLELYTERRQIAAAIRAVELLVDSPGEKPKLESVTPGPRRAIILLWKVRPNSGLPPRRK